MNKCCWMQAGVVSYKLCDRSYECERCGFDYAIRNRGALFQDFLARELGNPPTLPDGGQLVENPHEEMRAAGFLPSPTRNSSPEPPEKPVAGEPEGR